MFQNRSYIIERRKSLSSRTIKFNTLKDLNSESQFGEKVIKAFEFHSKARIGLVASLSGVASLFEVL